MRSGQITVPGYEHDRFSAFYPFAVASPVIRALELERHGLVWRRAPLVVAHPSAEGPTAVLAPTSTRRRRRSMRSHQGTGRSGGG